MLKRGHYANLDALVQDLLLMFDNAMSYNIEESGIYQAAVRCRHLTLKAAKALNASDRGNGNSLDCNIEHNEINKFSPASKKVKITNSVNPTYNGFASAEQKVVPSHFHTEPQQQQTGERIQSFHQNYIQPTGPSTSSTQAQFFQCSASTSSVQQNSLNSTSNHSILASDSSQLLLTNVPSTVVSQSCQDTGRMFVSLAPKQMPIEPMFASPSTSIHIRRNSNNSKHKEDEVVRALWKLRDNIVEGTTGIARSQGIPYEADAPEPPLVTTARKGRPPKNVNTYNKNS
uniref:Bromo domain-containing protein n=1 Tax=Meloidogyne hapla TaxID=6305 RepID=A0A1I8BHV4_MELHA